MDTVPSFLRRSGATELAYYRLHGAAPGVVFIHGLMSNMNGDKAKAIEALCRARGRGFVRFDCTGHGQSQGRMRDCTIGGWAQDTIDVIDALTEGPQILVGSSLGGWLMLLAALARPQRIAGLVGIAAAPDFVESLWEGLPEESRQRIDTHGELHLPSQYGPEPYCITRSLIEDGRRNCLLRRPIDLEMPVRLLHGMNDPDVPWRTSLRLAEALRSQDIVVQLIKDGDHRLSRPQDLERLCTAVEELSALVCR